MRSIATLCLAVLMVSTLAPAPQSSAAVAVTDVIHITLQRVEWLRNYLTELRKYQVMIQRLAYDARNYARLAERAWRDPEYQLGEFVYWHGLMMKRYGERPEGYDDVENLVYSLEDVAEKAREIYSGFQSFREGLIGGVQVETYSDLAKVRSMGVQGIFSEAIEVANRHQAQLVEGAIAKKKLLDSMENAEGEGRKAEALAQLVAFMGEEQMAMRQIAMTELNVVSALALDLTTRRSEQEIAWSESFQGFADRSPPPVSGAWRP